MVGLPSGCSGNASRGGRFEEGGRLSPMEKGHRVPEREGHFPLLCPGSWGGHISFASGHVSEQCWEAWHSQMPLATEPFPHEASPRSSTENVPGNPVYPHAVLLQGRSSPEDETGPRSFSSPWRCRAGWSSGLPARGPAPQARSSGESPVGAPEPARVPL